jgi:hypothetical protein
MKKSYFKAAGFMVLLCTIVFPLGAQLSGVYTINSAQGTGGTNYQTFSAFASDINSQGISGDVTVNVATSSGPYNEQVTFTQITGASSSDRVVINGNGNLLTFAGVLGSSHTMLLNGTDFFSVNNLKMEGTGTTYAMACVLTNGADNNEFTNCEFTTPVGGTGTNQVPFSISSSASSPSGGSNSGNFNTVSTCTMNNGYYGTFLYGYTSAPYQTNNTVTRCLVTDFYTYGIYYPYQKFATISKNTVQRPTRTSNGTVYGLAGWYNQGSLTDGNIVQKLFEMNQTSTSSCYAIYTYYNPISGNSLRNMVSNNIVRDIKHNGTIYGIMCYYMNGYIWHNTLSIDHTGSTSGTVYGIYAYGGAGYPNEVANNMVSITKGGSGTKYGIYNAGVTGNFTSEKNNLYVNSSGGTNYTGYYSAPATNLAALQSQGIDLNSFDLNPNFVNLTTDLHPTNTNLNNEGIPLGVLFDQEDAVRHTTTPDIGALEFLTPVCSGTPSNTIAGPNYSLCPGESATFSIGGLSSDLGYTYQWRVSDVSQVGTWTLLPGSTSIMYTAPSVTGTAWYSAIITCTAPGGTSITPVMQVNVMGPTQSTIPYYENFEGIGRANRLPNCSWTSPDLGGNARTYVNAGANNLLPRSGSSFASFNTTSPGQSYYYTNEIWMEPGITYSASLWFQTDFTGGTNFTDLSILVGTAQSPTGLVSIASTNGPAVSPVYKSLSNIYTVNSPGYYYVAVRATAAAGSALNLSWDDLRIEIPCTTSLNTPTITLSTTTPTICSGETIVINAAGATTYMWNDGSTGASVSDQPYNNTIYTVVGTNTLTGCKSTATQAVVVKQTPNLSVFAFPPVVCAGKPVSLQASGADTYAWSTGGFGPNISATPAANTSYQVSGTGSNNCVATAIVQVVVNALPNVAASVNNQAPCVGDPIVLSGSGALTYQWVSGSPATVFQGQNPTLMATGGASSYTVTGTDVNGCTNTAMVALAAELCTGLRESRAIAGISVYPNPTNAGITISFSEPGNNQVRVTDVTGRVVAEQNSASEKVNVNLDGFAAGVYYVNVQNDLGRHVTKVVKQ